mgnify:FL=1
MKRITKQEAIESFGKENVQAAISQGAYPTSRVMYPSFENTEHIGKDEYAGVPVTMDGCRLTAFWYLSPEEESDTDSFDFENKVEFYTEQTF